MKAIVLALALTTSTAFNMAPEAFKAHIEAHVEAMKARNDMLEGMPRTEVGKKGIASTIYNAATSLVGRVRSMYTLRSDDDDVADDNKFAAASDSELCKYIHNTGCNVDLSAAAEEQFYDQYNFNLGDCSTCAYELHTWNINGSSSCYTCPSGYSLQVIGADSSDDFPAFVTAQYFDCTGLCIEEDQVEDFQASALSLMGYTFTDIDESECKPYGTKYPLDCFASDSDDAVCFSGMDTVQLESGETKMLSEVQVGDRVLSADAQGTLSYSDVVFLPHAANNKAATFVNIATEGGKALKATKTHLVQTCAGELTYAGALKAGDCLRTVDGEERVASTSATKAEGIYSVVAQNEFIVVGGIVASPFAFAHGATNAVYNIHRALYKVAPAFLKSSAVISANAVLGAAAVLAANLFTQAK